MALSGKDTRCIRGRDLVAGLNSVSLLHPAWHGMAVDATRHFGECPGCSGYVANVRAQPPHTP
jgi:hypothetical protein